ncbi:MAG: cellulase family glycosylhydrolase [Anaerolineaceae bacterium]
MQQGIAPKAGINLGGWLSQYKQYNVAHFDSFIQEDDLKRIDSWGMDHVRLPVDYPVLEEDANPGVYLESGFAYIDKCLSWCQKLGLNLVLDIHKAPGYVFDHWKKTKLFERADLSKRYLALWEALARRYRGAGGLVFELLNEINLPDPAPWNRLIRQTITRIHQVDADRLVMIGGNYHNAADQLETLVYTFHFYNPMVVTHQKAYWVKPLENLQDEVNYPGIYPNIPDFGPRLVGEKMDSAMLRTYLQPALAFTQRTGKPLYCGEFGVIDRAPIQARLNWTRDSIAILQEYGIGWALWTYKAMDFGLVDAEGRVTSQELIDLVSQQKRQ